MGYEFKRKSELSFHHTIIPRRYCKALGLGEGYIWVNGAILVQDTSHEYLHLIECKDMDRFIAITQILIEENINGRLDIESIKKIDDILYGFEKEYCGLRNKKGRLLIKEEYTNRLVRKKERGIE